MLAVYAHWKRWRLASKCPVSLLGVSESAFSFSTPSAPPLTYTFKLIRHNGCLPSANVSAAPLSALCYNVSMKISVPWVLYEYVEHQPKMLSKKFKTKKEAERARQRLPQKKANRVGVGTIRFPA